MPIVALYAALLGLVFIGLSLRTVRLRHTLGIAIGDSGNAAMLRAMRVHSNFAEYAPLALILVYLVEASGGAEALVHALGAGLFLGRAVHAYGVSQARENYAFRVVGMALTLSVLSIAALCLLYFSLVSR